MIALLVYVGFLAFLWLLPKTPLLGKAIAHGVQHALGHVYEHDPERYLWIAAAAVWVLLLVIPAGIVLGAYQLSLAAMATLLFLYLVCNPRH